MELGSTISNLDEAVVRSSVRRVAVLTVVLILGAYGSIVYVATRWQGSEYCIHMVLMPLAFFVLAGNALLMFRAFRGTNKPVVKGLHAVFLILGLFCAIGGIYFVRDKFQHFSSWPVHGWLGFTTVVLYGLQWIVGFVSFAAPSLSSDMKAAYKPTHVRFGGIIFISACITIIMGLELASTFSRMALLSIFLVLVSMFAVLYIITNPKYTRPPDSPPPQSLPLNSTEHPNKGDYNAMK